jgi:cell shape-determining protein MreD
MSDKHLYDASGKYVGRLSDESPYSNSNDDDSIVDRCVGIVAFAVIGLIASIPYVSLLGVIVMGFITFAWWQRKGYRSESAAELLIIRIVCTGGFLLALYSAIQSVLCIQAQQ